METEGHETTRGRGFGPAIDNKRNLMPGLHLAVAIRQQHARGRHVEAIRTLMAELNLGVGATVEWYTALTGWQPMHRRASLPAVTPEPAGLTAKALAATFDRVGDDIYDLYGESEARQFIVDALYRIAVELRNAH